MLQSYVFMWIRESTSKSLKNFIGSEKENIQKKFLNMSINVIENIHYASGVLAYNFQCTESKIFSIAKFFYAYWFCTNLENFNKKNREKSAEYQQHSIRQLETGQVQIWVSPIRMTVRLNE